VGSAFIDPFAIERMQHSRFGFSRERDLPIPFPEMGEG
jgi:hypothetical protein